MALIAPRLTENFNEDPRQRFMLEQFFRDMLNMAFRISLKAKDGTIGDGKRAYNIDAVWVAYVSNSVADTEDTVSHSLGRVPLAAFVGLPDKNAVIYDSGTDWTATDVYLKSTAATTTVNLLLF